MSQDSQNQQQPPEQDCGQGGKAHIVSHRVVTEGPTGPPPSGRFALEEEEPPLHRLDGYTSYEEIVMADGRILRRYETGSVRVENPKSGIIQEERVDGSLVVSLPSGRVIFQEHRGEPVLVYDLELGGTPRTVRVVSTVLPGSTGLTPVFFFQDAEGGHLVDMETLRYFRIKKQQPAPGAPSVPAPSTPNPADPNSPRRFSQARQSA